MPFRPSRNKVHQLGGSFRNHRDNTMTADAIGCNRVKSGCSWRTKHLEPDDHTEVEPSIEVGRISGNRSANFLDPRTPRSAQHVVHCSLTAAAVWREHHDPRVPEVGVRYLAACGRLRWLSSTVTRPSGTTSRLSSLAGFEVTACGWFW